MEVVQNSAIVAEVARFTQFIYRRRHALKSYTNLGRDVTIYVFIVAYA